ncbi:MAG: helix-turn-helix domain-containing protein [Thomasclavelia sp.]|uniref:helix-turn-helix domain-containing protein n=1 Tax=Thomasclavelia sp. TaxID=3025757 RepID=UPI0039A3E48D
MFDEMQNKIIDATMLLIMEKGYASTTTKDIAKMAKINECTIFRKFKGKKDIILAAISTSKWNPDLKVSDFSKRTYNLENDLTNFSLIYMRKITPEMIKISMGLRTPELYEDTKDEILKVPLTFKKVLVDYFNELEKMEKLTYGNTEHLAMMFLSLNFGFVFLNSTFGKSLSKIEQIEYIKNSIKIFCYGLT